MLIFQKNGDVREEESDTCGQGKKGGGSKKDNNLRVSFIMDGPKHLYNASKFRSKTAVTTRFITFNFI